MSASPIAATVSVAGISAPNFAQVLAYLQAQYQTIFGADVYLGNDSQDGQWLGVLTQAFTDCNAAAIAVYNSFSPATAQGVGLSSNVKINGLARLIASYSTAVLTITGTVNTTITNGQASDTNGNLRNLPGSVTIPSGGVINVTATAAVAGDVTAGPTAITTIATPVSGWSSVSNASAAIPGAAVETDAALRIRQSASVTQPSQTIFEGIIAAIETVAGVARVGGDENNTNATNSNGIPANTLAFVVENGVPLAVATAINSKMPPGIATYAVAGSLGYSESITDTTGATRIINFSAPIESYVGINITINPGINWSTALEALIINDLANYVNALPIGAPVSYSSLFLPAYNQAGLNSGAYTISVMTINKNGGSSGMTDLPILWDEAPYTNGTYITFTVL